MGSALVDRISKGPLRYLTAQLQPLTPWLSSVSWPVPCFPLHSNRWLFPTKGTLCSSSWCAHGLCGCSAEGGEEHNLSVWYLQRRRKGVFPQKLLLHHFSGSHGNSFHSTAAFGGLGSCTVLLSCDTAWRCAGALSRRAPSCKSPARGCQCQGWDLPSPRAGQGSWHGTDPGNHLTSWVVEKKSNTKETQNRLEAEEEVFCPAFEKYLFQVESLIPAWAWQSHGLWMGTRCVQPWPL